MNQGVQPTNDDTFGTSFDHEKDNFSNFYPDNGINDYEMKTSLTIDYDRQMEIENTGVSIT
jgi:hypothetical protein